MSTAIKDNAPNEVLDYIQESVKAVITDQFNAAIKEATEKAEAKRDEVIASTALRLSSYMDIQSNGQQIKITIEKKL